MWKKYSGCQHGGNIDSEVRRTETGFLSLPTIAHASQKLQVSLSSARRKEQNIFSKMEASG